MADADDARLPDRAEALLAGWPIAERDEDGWEELARKIEAKAKTTQVGLTEDELLDPPLPETDADGAPTGAAGSQPVSAGDPPREESRSLADLARAVAEPQEDDSLRSIAAETLSLAQREQLRAPSEREEPERETAKPAAEVVELDRARRAATVPAEAARPTHGAGQDRTGIVIGAASLAVGIAAAVAIYVGRAPEPEPVAMTGVPEPAPATKAEAPAPAAEKPKPEDSKETIVSLDELPTGSTEARTRASAKNASPKGAAPTGIVAATSEPSGVTRESAPEEVASALPAPADPDEAKMKMAEGQNRPLQPSTGEVQAALGSVIGGARACVAAHDKPSRATVTFGSDGRVQNVSVTGPAAGTPAAGCIRAALKSARVGRFAKPTFTAAATIRPP